MQILTDGNAIYKGIMFRKRIPFIVIVKEQNRGKRDSHRIFFEYMHKEIIERTEKSIMVRLELLTFVFELKFY